MGCEVLGALARQDASESGKARRATVVHTINGEDREVDGPGPHMIDGVNHETAKLAKPLFDGPAIIRRMFSVVRQPPARSP